MDWAAIVRARLALQPSPTDDIERELAQHLEDLYDEGRRDGLSHDEAVGLATAALDGEAERLQRDLTTARQSPRARFDERWAEAIASAPEAGWRRLLGDLRRDLLYALRMLVRTPGFTAAAVVTLALGIGVNTAIFSLVNAMVLARLPVRDVDRLVQVGNGAMSGVFSYPGYADLRDRSDAFDGLACWGGIVAVVDAPEGADTVDGAIVSGNYFDVLGVTAGIGRLLTPADDRHPGEHAVVVISHGLWQRRFGGRADIVGQPMMLNGHKFSVVGVTRPEFEGVPAGTRRDLYVPMMVQAIMRPPRANYSGDMNPDLLKVATNRWLFVIGRLRPGLTREQAQASLSALQMALDPPDRRPTGLQGARTPLAAVSRVPPGQRDWFASMTRLLWAIVAAVLLIACANVANLLLSRGLVRRREIALRLALGAGRGRLVRQLLTESVLLAVTGGLLGIGLAHAVVHAFRAWPPPENALPLALEFAVDHRVLLFTLTLSVLTGVVFGLVPALRASRPALVPALKDHTFVPGDTRRRIGLNNALVIVQVALSLALLIVSGLFVRSFQEAQRIEPGYDVDRLATLDLRIALLRYTRTQGRDFYQRVVERAAAIPGVESAALARVSILTGGGRVTTLHVEGRPGTDDRFTSEGSGTAPSSESVYVNVVSDDFFRTLGVGVRQGHTFGDEDTSDSQPVAVVSNAFARQYFGDGTAIGQRVSINGDEGPWRLIVGVVNDAKYASLSESAAPIAYVPLSQNHETGMTLYVRSTAASASVRGLLRGEIQALDPNLPLREATSMTETIAASLYGTRMGALLTAALGALALTLASVGLYGVLAFAVTRRTREMGIRRALGAGSASLFRMVLSEGLLLVALGVAAGVGLAWSTSGLLGAFLIGIAPTNAPTYAAVAAILAGVAVAACTLPAWRATRVDPLIAIREQ